MGFAIQYHTDVITKDIPPLSQEWRGAVKQAIEEKLTTHPEVFGKPLHASLKGYRKLRVGDYRVIFRIENALVKILAIQHRSVIYKNLEKRI
ncbi:MAG: type II toxin-antitoxin system RelE/ParE family toxin [Candidatus Wildermuthbacteria bacterium]|nr:type II toxin-antitoxin system RelE/ParE family toxin [Candidatus Wildermuthbacteria bacterium]